jgi:hypothetical protein
MRIQHLSAAALLLLAAGCQEDAATADPNQVVIVVEDPDAAPMPEPDATVEPDAESLPPHLDAPEAWVYADDPITNDGALTQVPLTRTVHEDGRLTSDWVAVFNCLNEDGGLSGMPDFGGLSITVSLCHEVQTALPDADGNYLSIQPPADESDPNDPFAEVMMYYHVNQAHDFFKDTLGFEGLDRPLPALVNVQIKMDPPLPIPGLELGPDGWMAFPNAAYFPEEAWRQLTEQFGLPPRNSDSIVFGQADNDFAYDGRVIYHEYTHAVIGTGRLSTPAMVDQYGLDNSSFSMNEGLADYFAATVANDPVVGRYGIGSFDPDLVRDLSDHKICPRDTYDEVHAHGKVIGSTMWAVRDVVGAEIADQIVFGALEQFGPRTNHQVAGALLLTEAERLGVAEAVEPILTDSGLLGCERAIPWTAYRGSALDGGGHRVEGTASTGVFGLTGGAPAYKQFYVELPEAAPEGQAVRLTWTQAPGQGGLGGASGPAALHVATQHGAPVDVHLMGQERYSYDQRLMPALDGNTQVLTLAADCLTPGERLYLLWINPNQAATTVISTQLEWLDDASDDANLVHCQEAPDPEPEPDAGLPDMPEDAGAMDAEPADAGLPEAP